MQRMSASHGDPAPDPAFTRRLDRWGGDLRSAVAAVHPDAWEDVVDRLVAVAVRRHAERPTELRELDERRLLRPDWLQQPGMFGYACYADRFAPRAADGPGPGGDLAGVGERLSYLEDLGVT